MVPHRSLECMARPELQASEIELVGPAVYMKLKISRQEMSSAIVDDPRQDGTSPAGSTSPEPSGWIRRVRHMAVDYQDGGSRAS